MLRTELYARIDRGDVGLVEAVRLMRKVADRVVFLHEGKVIFFGATEDLETSDHPFIQEFLEMDRIVKV